ncbi:hypothetical protein [Polyangium mundeleinium]|uniref:Uncharacterized protein n=1 Tax=Polyangium mundeleinium TaxID=2995306 RepID=A0ABT5EZ94_9BACT|nr:hypothetical protein [Polyangium mundeleinium]MDC0747135.1 hypothetical protein [Polyangium mundeleinium]
MLSSKDSPGIRTIAYRNGSPAPRANNPIGAGKGRGTFTNKAPILVVPAGARLFGLARVDPAFARCASSIQFAARVGQTIQADAEPIEENDLEEDSDEDSDDDDDSDVAEGSDALVPWGEPLTMGGPSPGTNVIVRPRFLLKVARAEWSEVEPEEETGLKLVSTDGRHELTIDVLVFMNDPARAEQRLANTFETLLASAQSLGECKVLETHFEEELGPTNEAGFTLDFGGTVVSRRLFSPPSCSSSRERGARARRGRTPAPHDVPAPASG